MEVSIHGVPKIMGLVHFVENPIPITIDDLSGGFPYDSGNLETGAQEHHFNGPNGPSTVIMSP